MAHISTENKSQYNPEIQKRITTFEHGLRYKVFIKGEENKRMSLADRMQYYKVP